MPVRKYPEALSAGRFDNWQANIKRHMDAELFSDDPRKCHMQLIAEYLLRKCGPTHDGNRVDWHRIELDLGVALPLSFKKTSDLIPTAMLGDGLWWKSHVSTESGDQLDRASLENLSRRCAGFSKIPIYPIVPGYLIFATAPDRINLSFRVECDKSGRLQCAPEVVLLDMSREEVERTKMETDEFLYRCITSKPPLRGPMSEYLARWVFGEPSTP